MTLLRRVVWAESDCWLWSGAVGSSGYGRTTNGYAHRDAYALLVGPIPDGYQIDHLCKTRTCINPRHLEAVTQKVNIQRSDAPGSVLHRSDRCLRGHSLTEHGYVRRDNGCRMCRVCANARRRSSYVSRKAAAS